jgi:S1-C subfamily serine protease
VVQPGSMAEDAGIIEGDIVLSLGEHPVCSADELFGIVEVLPAGIPVSVILVRNGRRFERLLVTHGRRRKIRKG